jgi:hypothetical protein
MLLRDRKNFSGLALVQKGIEVVMLEGSEKSGGGVDFNIHIFLHFGKGS